MAADDAADILGEMIPDAHAKGRDDQVEALSEAVDALRWRPLREAPRDGTYVLIAVAPAPQWGLDGFVALGRWIPATSDAVERAQLGKLKRQRAQAADGWWSTSGAAKPLQRPVLAWRPAPAFDFETLWSNDADLAGEVL